MDTAWLVLLLPLAAASGWWLSARKAKESSEKKYHQSCLLGINQLLSSEDDAALESFLDAVGQQPKSVEFQILLGNLCRRKGEYERASLMHQSILNQLSHPVEIREQAQFELAQDYQAAGWLDRSESLYQELMKSSNYQLDTANNLLKLYQHQRDWSNAIQTAKFLQAQGHKSQYLSERLAHYHCELCEQNIRDGHFPDAEHSLSEAEKTEPTNPRVLILNARLATFKGEPEKAVEIWRKLEWMAPGFVGVSIAYIHDSFELLQNKPAYITFLKQAVTSSHDPKVLSALLDTFQTENVQKSSQFLIQYIKDKPSLEGLKQILLNWKELPNAISRDELMFLVEAMVDLVRSEAKFQCLECGFKAEAFEWSCPGCQQWGTYQCTSLSLRGVEHRSKRPLASEEGLAEIHTELVKGDIPPH